MYLYSVVCLCETLYHITMVDLLPVPSVALCIPLKTHWMGGFIQLCMYCVKYCL